MAGCKTRVIIGNEAYFLYAAVTNGERNAQQTDVFQQPAYYPPMADILRLHFLNDGSLMLCPFGFNLIASAIACSRD